MILTWTLNLASQAFTGRTTVSHGVASEVLGCPTPSSPEVMLPFLQLEWSPVSRLSLQDPGSGREYDIHCQTEPPPWTLLCGLECSPHWSQIQTSCPRRPTSGPFSSSPSSLWNQNSLPPALRTTSKWKFQVQNFPMTQIHHRWLSRLVYMWGLPWHTVGNLLNG